MAPPASARARPARRPGGPRRPWAGPLAVTAALLLSACSSGGSSGGGSSTSADLRAPDASELSGVSMGWSAAAVPGVDQSIIGTWMERKSWENLEKGQWLADNPTFTDYVRAHPQGAADIGVPLIPHDSGDDLDGMLREAISGTRDSTYRAMGAALARVSPATVYARLWWEMNLRPMADGIDQGLFKQAWAHAVPLVREGFSSVARPGQVLRIVFSPNADGADYQGFYPGDDYVDLMALDAYGQRWGTSTPSQNQLLSLVRSQLDAFTSFARQHGKRVAMAEWANVAEKGDGNGDQMQGRGDFPAYVALVLDWAAQHKAVYLVYFNSDEGGVGQTLSDTPKSLAVLEKAWS